jgi:C-terminal processing protease CtpA/Prc
MRNSIRLSILIGVLGAAVALACTQTHSAVVSGTLPPAQTQADFDLMRRALEEAHGGLYRYSSKAEMDRVFGAERAKLNSPLTKPAFMAVLMETLAQIRCGHTGLAPDEDTQKEMAAAKMFPLRITVEGRRLIVLSNDTVDDKTIRPGMEITEINDRKPAYILNRILPKLAADGDVETGKRTRLQRTFSQNYWIFVDRTEEFTVRARDAAGTTVTSKLPGVIDSERKRNSTRNPLNAEFQAIVPKLEWWSENLAMRFLKDPDIAEIHIGGFGGSAYPKWMEETFKTLREKGTRALIIDLRGNGGGTDMYGAMLVSYLTDKPFRYFDHIDVKTISPSFKEHSDWQADREPRLRELMIPNPAGGYLVPAKLHPGVEEQPPGKYPFMGKVFVLIDGGTFSTAADFCAVAHHLKRATFIGEETGGGYYGNNSGMQAMLTLPNSKMRIRVPMYQYWNAVPGYDGKRRGTRPDHFVETRVANLLRGVDEQLDLAMKLAGQGGVK